MVNPSTEKINRLVKKYGLPNETGVRMVLLFYEIANLALSSYYENKHGRHNEA
jgi:hypothetical protein